MPYRVGNQIVSSLRLPFGSFGAFFPQLLPSAPVLSFLRSGTTGAAAHVSEKTEGFRHSRTALIYRFHVHSDAFPSLGLQALDYSDDSFTLHFP